MQAALRLALVAMLCMAAAQTPDPDDMMPEAEGFTVEQAVDELQESLIAEMDPVEDLIQIDSVPSESDKPPHQQKAAARAPKARPLKEEGSTQEEGADVLGELDNSTLASMIRDVLKVEAHATKAFAGKVQAALTLSEETTKQEVKELHLLDIYGEYRKQLETPQDLDLQEADQSVAAAQMVATEESLVSGTASCAHFVAGTQVNSTVSCTEGNAAQCLTSEVNGLAFTSMCDVSKMCDGGEGSFYQVGNGKCGILPTGQKIYCSTTSPPGGVIPQDMICPPISLNLDTTSMKPVLPHQPLKQQMLAIHTALGKALNSATSHSRTALLEASKRVQKAAKEAQEQLETEEERVLASAKKMAMKAQERTLKHAKAARLKKEMVRTYAVPHRKGGGMVMPPVVHSTRLQAAGIRKAVMPPLIKTVKQMAKKTMTMAVEKSPPALLSARDVLGYTPAVKLSFGCPVGTFLCTDGTCNNDCAGPSVEGQNMGYRERLEAMQHRMNPRKHMAVVAAAP